jgi:hypothetical protein
MSCRGEKWPRTTKKKSIVVNSKKKWIVMNPMCGAPNEKTQVVQDTERPIGALVVVGSLWPRL